MRRPDRGPRQAASHELLEIWGDTVNGRHLLYAVLIGGTGGLLPLLLADALLPRIEDNRSLAHAYALLVGLIACVLMGVICARLFSPQRVVVEAGAEDSDRQEVLNVLRGERLGLGTVGSLPAETVAELRELELYDLFRDGEAESAASTAPSISHEDRPR
jgi:hypothetical protein